MTPSLVVAFWGVSVVFVLTPGGDWAYAITAGVRYRSIGPAVAGLLGGHLVATLLVAAGVAARLAQSTTLVAVMTTAGAAYLVWLGLGMWRDPAVVHQRDPNGDTGTDVAVSSGWRQAATGLGISGLNPKVFLLFLALLPQFVSPSASWPVAAQIVALGLVHVVTCAVIYSIVGLCARRVLVARPTVARVVGRVSAAVMIVLGLVLINEQLWARARG